MSVSDDEVEESPKSVTNYYFEDGKEEPISFCALPICWDADETVSGSEKMIYVRGRSEDGLVNIYKLVKAWKFDVSGGKPEISVLLNDNNWIKLQKPRNSYGEFIRTALITVRFLHLVKKNPELLGKAIWDKLSKIFSLLEEKPSLHDLEDHRALIQRAVERDVSLKKSKYLMAFLDKKLLKKDRGLEAQNDKGRNDFIVNDCAIDDPEENASVYVEGHGGADDSSSDEEDGNDDCCDSVCFICDEGGSLLCCEGSCMRSFHPTPGAAEEAESGCRSLGFTEEEVEGIEHFHCQNCQLKLHQCYSCGRLGSSDSESAPEVFQCVNATCGYFYHPGCVVKQLHCDNEDAAKVLEKNISAGEPFTCPLHVCFVCGQPENNSDPELRMAVCRRCPKAYHNKCLPREIPFEDIEDEGIIQRAWDNLLVDRILIYCLDHEILEALGTPSRNHIKFPGDEKKRKEPAIIKQLNNKLVPKSKKPLVNRLSRQGSVLEPKKSLLKNHANDNSLSKSKGAEKSKNFSVVKKYSSRKVEVKGPDELDFATCIKSDKPGEVESKLKRPLVNEHAPQLDSESERRILDIMTKVSSEITLSDIIKKREKLVSSHAYKQKMDICKNITLGKVEGFCKAAQTAAIKLDAGGSVEEAKAICEPKILDQLIKWKSKLRVYLAPFLHGMRYTSYGRHFTKVEKLNEIVDILHWYVNGNDTIVDFCCGANDFSCLMKQKLESMGKTCHFRNYDLFRPKNDFCFEERDWLSVQTKELPTGSQLIIGLNPPFGVKGALANQFINKALEFKPKLLILIVPPETERLDKKKERYDLVWEDRYKLSGKSFYLPGSVDSNDKQMEDWNVVSPVLYLWSRSDWTEIHMKVAKKHHHPRGQVAECNQNQPSFEGVSTLADGPKVAVTKAKDVSDFAGMTERVKKGAAGEKKNSAKNHSRDGHLNSVQETSKANWEKKRRTEETFPKEVAESSRELKRHRSSPLNTPHEWHRSSPLNTPHERHRQSPSFPNGGMLPSSSRNHQTPTNVEIRHPSPGQFESTSFGYGRYLSGQAFRYQESPTLDLHGQHTIYRGKSREVEIPGGHYDNVGNHYPPQANYHSHISPPPDYPSQFRGHISPPPDYPSQFRGHIAPGYIGGPDAYGANQLYSKPEQRSRAPALSSGSHYNRMGDKSASDKYLPRLDELNHAYERNPGHPSRVVSYNNPDLGQPGLPMGFTPGPVQPYYRHHSAGGWIDD